MPCGEWKQVRCLTKLWPKPARRKEKLLYSSCNDKMLTVSDFKNALARSDWKFSSGSARIIQTWNLSMKSCCLAKLTGLWCQDWRRIGTGRDWVSLRYVRFGWDIFKAEFFPGSVFFVEQHKTTATRWQFDWQNECNLIVLNLLTQFSYPGNVMYVIFLKGYICITTTQNMQANKRRKNDC